MAAFGSPRTLGRYTLLTELASSHLGPLWLVKDDSGALAMARRVRLGANPDQSMVDRISEAAFTATEIDQPLVSKVTEVLLQGSEIGVVQTCLEGATLRTVQRSATTRRKPVPPEVAIRLVFDLLEALSSLHGYQDEFGELGSLLFGGVNPDSLLVSTTGRLYLLDPLVSGAASTIESIRNHSDRLAYTSPEQNEEATVDARSDVFCVGILLWELLAERRLFMGMGKSVAQKVKALKIPRLDQIEFKDRPALSGSIADVVAQALDREPSQRFQSTAEMRSALEAAGLDAANPDQVARYVEGVAEFELRKQRQADATPGTNHVASPELRAAGLSRKLPEVIPRRELPSKPNVGAPQGSTPDAVPAPPKRAAKQTLLGLAPPKPGAEARTAKQAAEPAKAAKVDPSPAPAPTLESASAESDEPPTLVADVASIARALEESQRKGGASKTQEGHETSPAGGPSRSESPDVPAAATDEQAFDAELEAVYENPVPVRMASIDPKMGAASSTPAPTAQADGAVAAALADALAPVKDKGGEQPESTDLGDLLSPATNDAGGTSGNAAPAAERRSSEESPAGEASPEASPSTTAEPAAAIAVPLIHDQRFGGPGPRGPRGRTNFLGGILVGAAVAFVLVLVLVVILLVVVLRRGAQEAVAPVGEPSAKLVVGSTAAPSVAPGSASAPAAESAEPKKPEEPAASEEPQKPDASEESKEPDESEEPSTASAAPAPKPRPRPKPKPKPKPSFVPDEI